jgi:hypothetical protein
MNKQEDKLFDMYRDSFQGFQPEAPASIYAGVRKKMMWSNFMAFNLSTLNVWYLGLILLGGLGTIGYVSIETSMGQMTAEHNVLQDFQAPQLSANQNVISTVEADFSEPVAMGNSDSTPIQEGNSSKGGNDLKPDPVDAKPIGNWKTSDDRKMSFVPVEIMTAPVKLVPQIQPERVVFTVENALQIELNDLVSQIENQNSGEITFKLPVTLPATDQ